MASLLKTYIFFSLLVASGGSFLYEIYKHYRYMTLGRPENRFDRPFERWRGFFTYAVGQKRIMDYPLIGIFHGFIMWGFLVLLIDIPNMAAEGLFHSSIPYVGNDPVYLIIEALFDVLVIIGVIGGLFRRTVIRPKSLDNNPVGIVTLLLILVIVITEVLFHGTQFALHQGVALRTAVPLVTSGLLAHMNTGILLMAKDIFWWTYFLAIFALLFILPRSKHLHLVFAPLNTYWRSLDPKGSLSKIQLEEGKGKTYGVNKIEDLTWKQIFDTFACVKCGRCNDSCPAHQSDEPLKPKKLSGRLRKHIEKMAPLLLKHKGHPSSKEQRRVEMETVVAMTVNKTKKSGRKNNIAGDLFDQEFIWGCATCGSCVQACPVFVEHISKLIDMRRYLVSKGSVTDEIKQVFAKIDNYGNPWGLNRKEGPTWENDLGIPTLSENPGARYLYFVGCAGLFDERAKKVTRSFLKILKAAGVDFAVLGDDEWCCGETARRMGNEYLFQKTARDNVANWNGLGVKRIITTCPHCFNTLKNEYSQFGGVYKVTHHSTFMANLLKQGKLKPHNNFDQIGAYQDPCYLGRYNNFYNEPRAVLMGIPGLRLVNMPLSREKSFCCGAGGGRIWTKANQDNLIAKNLVKEALRTKAQVISTACPYCLMMISREIESMCAQNRIMIKDIAEILELSLPY